ncbi:MAG TPA: hypothetical protein VJS92_08855 [Candidatus Polarisedimenticolaceae bacterium]|nr:hypothetical protein [Candidatus Polarisedimenticolaceae bacterium]
MTRTTLRCGAVSLAAFALTGTTMTWAQTRTIFAPQVGLAYGWTDNVAFVDTGTNADTSDSYGSLSLLLPVTRKLRTGQLQVAYALGYVRYLDVEDLNYADHRLSFGLSLAPDRNSSFTVSANYALTQQQGDPSTSADPGFFLSERTKREAGTLTLGYQRGFGSGARWQWGIDVGATVFRFDEIEGVTDPMAPLPLQEKNAYYGTTHLARNITRRTAIGLLYGHRRYELSDVATEDVDEAAVTLTHQFTEAFGMGLNLGYFTRSQDPVDVEDDSGTRFGLTFNYNRPVGPVKLGFGATVDPSSGGALEGTSTDTTVSLDIARGDSGRTWNWGGALRFTRRDPTDPAFENIDTRGVSAYVEAKAHERLGFRLAFSRTRQTSDDPLLEGEVNQGTLVAVWYPLGHAPVERAETKGE